MTFQQLAYILEVHRTGSVSKAASHLFISRSSVSSSITSLENELGYSIFVRTLQGLTPSEKGQKFLEYADKICKTHQLMTNLGDATDNKLVSIGVNDYSPVIEATTELVREYRYRNDIRFSLGVYSVNEIVDKLCLFELDAAIFSRFGNMHVNIESILENRGLQWKSLGEVPTTLVIGNKHPLSRKEDLDLRDLENEIFLDTLGKEISKNSYLRSVTRINPDKILTTNSSSLRYHLLKDGIGYTVCRIPSRQNIRNYDLRCIHIPALSQPLIFAINPTRPISQETKRLLELIERKLKHSDA